MIRDALLKIVLPVAVIGVIGTGVATAAVVSQITHPFYSSKYNDNPAPLFRANTQLPSSSFITREEAISKVAAKTGGVLKSADLETWSQHVAKDEPNIGLHDRAVDLNRMTWVVKTNYPTGLDTKAGFYANATLVSVFDAQTEQLLESTVTGDYQGGGIPMGPSSSKH